VVLANAVLKIRILVTWQFFGGQSLSALVVSRARKFDGGECVGPFHGLRLTKPV
jgi:hypothetical protein